MSIFTPLADAQTYDGRPFPMGISGSGNLAEYIARHKSDIDAALAVSGAVLLRGFDVPDPLPLDAAIEAYGEPSFTYEDSLSNAVRVNVTPRVFTANEAPPSVSIYLHHEMAQTPIYPSKLFFYCQITPSEGGATPLCRSDIVLKQLRAQNPKICDKFETLGVRYTNIMPPEPDPLSGQGRSWRDTLSAPDKACAEARLSSLGYSWSWQEGDVLRVTTPVLEAIRALPCGDKVFFNQLIAAFRGWSDARNDASKSVTFGDGSPIEPSAMASAISIADALSYELNWQAGDVALIDNYRVMHGRRPYIGKRRVLASLIA